MGKSPAICSDPARIISDRFYKIIVDMGEPIIPLIMKEMKEGRYYFWDNVLSDITKGNPVPNRYCTTNEIIGYWLLWGRKNNYVKD